MILIRFIPVLHGKTLLKVEMWYIAGKEYLKGVYYDNIELDS